MIDLKEINIEGSYYQEDEPLENFYAPCLEHSIKYDRVAGYFRATVFRLISSNLSSFIENNGKIRINFFIF